jgi:hypothetical protein
VKRGRYGSGMAQQTTATERGKRGVQALGQLVTYWLAPVTHSQLSAILEWGYGEPTGLTAGVLSRIRNVNQQRGAGLKHLDAMAEANRALWTWHTIGTDAAVREFGPFSSCGIRQEWLDVAIWLPKPSDQKTPLDLGDFARLLVGRLELPYLGPAVMSPAESTHAIRKLSDLLEQLAAQQGWGPREAMAQFLEAYPSTDRGRRQLLRDVVLGTAELSHGELELELAALAEMVRTLRGLKAGSYGPADLRAELLFGRPGA